MDDKHKMDKVSKYLIAEQEKWRSKMIALGWTPADANSTAFARFLGVPNPSYSQWINKSRLPAGKNLNIICGVLGPEILVIMEDSDPMFRFVASLWPKLSRSQQEGIVEHVKRLMEEDIQDSRETQMSS